MATATATPSAQLMLCYCCCCCLLCCRYWLCAACNNGSGNRILSSFEHMYVLCTSIRYNRSLLLPENHVILFLFFLIKLPAWLPPSSTHTCGWLAGSQIVTTLMGNKLCENGSILRVICGRFKRFADRGKLPEFVQFVQSEQAGRDWQD